MVDEALGSVTVQTLGSEEVRRAINGAVNHILSLNAPDLDANIANKLKNVATLCSEYLGSVHRE